MRIPPAPLSAMRAPLFSPYTFIPAILYPAPRLPRMDQPEDIIYCNPIRGVAPVVMEGSPCITRDQDKAGLSDRTVNYISKGDKPYNYRSCDHVGGIEAIKWALPPHMCCIMQHLCSRVLPRGGAI